MANSFNNKYTFPSLSKESKNTPTPFHISADPNTGPSKPGFSVYQIAWNTQREELGASGLSNYTHPSNRNDRTRPSAPIRPLPVTRNVTSTSQFSKAAFAFVHTEPLWLFNDGAIRI